MGCVIGKLAAGEGPKEAGALQEPAPTQTHVAGDAPRAWTLAAGCPGNGRNKHPGALPSASRFVLPTGVPAPPGSAGGWPAWLTRAAGEAIHGWVPRRADSFEKLAKIGQGTYSNVYKARDLETGKVVALKKVRFDSLEPESVKFMAREIALLRRLDHPNVIKLEGLVISRVSCSLYLVFEYMEHDLGGLVASPDIKFSEPEVKCYMKQLLSGLEHCHNRGVMHRDIKGANLLINNEGILKIADFGLASSYDPNNRRPMTSRVVTLWYRPPELLLGATYYDFGIDIWSAGCILAELLSGKPILPGRTEVEQLHRIFKLCGSPSEHYWKKLKLPRATMFSPQQTYKRCVAETFSNLPPSSLSLIETLLAIDPEKRGTATAALNSEFFTTEPLACEPSSLPHHPPTKEMDVKLRDEESRRKKSDNKERNGGPKKTRFHNRNRAMPAPEANAELQINLDRRRLIAQLNAKSRSEKFPPPHKDGAVGVPLDEASGTQHMSFMMPDKSFASSVFDPQNLPDSAFPGGSGRPSLKILRGTYRRTKKTMKVDSQVVPSQIYVKSLRSETGLSVPRKKNKIHRKAKEKEIEVFGGGMQTGN
uniref:[RNA-polymerase]-subunit kinase n=1 Tax=Anthurium amnicola TaxID=1678845 RepID=A0A1D1XE90_9ARAE